MAKISIMENQCKGCELCTAVCPKNLLRLSEKINQKGYHPVECFDMNSCIGCAFCARMCPDCAIVVEK